MSKIIDFFQNPRIKMSFGLGFCILLIAIVFKKVIHETPTILIEATPGWVYMTWEVLNNKKNIDDKYKRPLWWIIGMIVASLLVIYFNM